MIGIILAGLACAVAGAYLENKFGGKVAAALPGVESRLKAEFNAAEARIKTDAATGIADAKAEVAKLEAAVKALVSKA